MSSRRGPLGVAAGVWALGFTSLFMDASSELVHALLPLFMVSTLGASMTAVGLIEGSAEAVAGVMRPFAGALSDAFGRRKPLVVAGYALAAASKPLFPLADALPLVLVARTLDRIGKGVRGAPRDALVADLTPPEARGAAYGLRQSLDTVGALLGPLLASVLLVALAGDLRAALWAAVFPAAVSVAIVAWGAREPPRPAEAPKRQGVPALTFRLGRPFWRLAGVAMLLGLSRFGEAFLILRGREGGLPDEAAPLVMAAMSAVYAATAFPAGRLSDRIGRWRLLALGIAALAAAHLTLAGAGAAWGVFAGAALWGLHMGLTQGLLAALVAEAAPVPARASAFGVFHLAGAATVFAASAAAGVLWDAYGAAAPFLAGAGFAALALAALPAARRGART